MHFRIDREKLEKNLFIILILAVGVLIGDYLVNFPTPVYLMLMVVIGFLLGLAVRR